MKELLKSLKEFTIFFIIMFVIELIIMMMLFFYSFDHVGVKASYPFSRLPIFVVSKSAVEINFINMVILNFAIALLLSLLSFFVKKYKHKKDTGQ